MKGGMSPRKAYASGMKEAAGPATSGGSFGVKSYDSMHGAPENEDRGMGHEAMDDGERGIGMPIHHTKGHMPAQAAPDHGPHRAMHHGKK